MEFDEVDVRASTHKYFGDLEAKDEYKVSFAENLIAEVLDSGELQVQATNNSPNDFINSPQLRVVIEDALWKQETSNGEVLGSARAMDPRKLISLLMEFGLHDRLQDRGVAG